jgi:phage shock protein C
LKTFICILPQKLNHWCDNQAQIRIKMTEDKNPNDSFEDNFFEKMESAPPKIPQRKLFRSKNDVVVAGVCSGIAAYMKVDTANVRLIMILSLLLGGWSVVAYLLFAVFIPPEINPEEMTDEDRDSQRKENFKVLISGLLLLVGFYYSLQKIGYSSTVRLFIFPNTLMIPVISLVAGAYLVSRKRLAKYIGLVYVTEEFFRSRKNRWLLGVCGGLADYIGIDTGTIRIMFVIFSLLTLGLFSIAYIIIVINTNFENITLDEK